MVYKYKKNNYHSSLRKRKVTYKNMLDMSKCFALTESLWVSRPGPSSLMSQYHFINEAVKFFVPLLEKIGPH